MNRFPPATKPFLTSLIERHPIDIYFKNLSSRKFGYFRVRFHDDDKAIFINSNLGEYMAFVTLLHEYAHFIVHEEHNHKVSPHGLEWKLAFRKLLQEWAKTPSCPSVLQDIFTSKNFVPKANPLNNPTLYDAINKLDNTSLTYLKDIENGSEFLLPKMKGTFVKQRKLRSRFLCLNKHSQAQYRIHPMAEIILPE